MSVHKPRENAENGIFLISLAALEPILVSPPPKLRLSPNIPAVVTQAKSYVPDMIKGMTIDFLLGDIFTLSLPLISSIFSVADSTARNLTGLICVVTLLIVIMLLGSMFSPLSGLESLDIRVTFTPALLVICKRIVNNWDGGGSDGGVSKQNISVSISLCQLPVFKGKLHKLALNCWKCQTFKG